MSSLASRKVCVGSRRPLVFAGRCSVALLCALPLVACGSEGPELPQVPGIQDPNVRSLLEEHPSARLETTGELIAETGAGWGPAAKQGWQSAGKRFGADVVAVNQAARAELWLDATGAEERTIRIEARATKQPGHVEVLLNGELLGNVRLLERQREFTLAAPASLWERGRNVLAFRAVDEAFEEAGMWGVGHVEIEPHELVESASMMPGSSVSWDLLTTSSGLIDLVAKGGAGTLFVEGRRIFADGERVEFEEAVTADEQGLLRLRMPFESTGGAPTRLTLTWGAPQLGAGGAPLELLTLTLYEDEPAPRPPVLFLSVDTLAAKNMSVYGYDRETTPKLQARLGDFITFDQAHSNSPWTAPSYASQFSGLYVSSVRISEEQRKAEQVPFGVGEYRIGAARTTLTELFAGRGYRTAGYVDNRFLIELTGFGQGFEVFDGKAALRDVRDHEMGAEYVFGEALDFLLEPDARPPFVFAQVLDVHGPYFPMEPYEGTYSDRVDPEDSTLLPVTERVGVMYREVPPYITKARHDEVPDEISGALLRADYDEKVLEMDARIDALLEELEQAGLYDSMLIVISADHGESMDDGDFYFTHGLVNQDQIHVPLLVKLPGQKGGGTRRSEPVQLVDLLPTFAEGLGVDTDQPLHGHSLWPLLQGQAPETHPLFAEASAYDHRGIRRGRWKLLEWHPRRASFAAIISAPFAQEFVRQLSPEVFEKLLGTERAVPGDQIADVYDSMLANNPTAANELGRQVRGMGPRYQLFDLEADPFERRDLAEEHPALVEELRLLLQAELARALEDRRHEEGRPQELSEETKAHLEALGYVAD